MLESLGVEGADNIQANCRGQDTAQMLEEEESLRGIPRNMQPASDRTEGWSPMAERGRAWGTLEHARGGCEQGAALSAAGAIGNVVGRKGVAESVQFGQPLRFRVSGGGQGERGVAHLLQVRFQERSEIRFGANRALPPGGLQAGGMRKAAGRKGRVGPLPQQPISVRSGCGGKAGLDRLGKRVAEYVPRTDDNVA